jgi:hypothetical protein
VLFGVGACGAFGGRTFAFAQHELAATRPVRRAR